MDYFNLIADPLNKNLMQGRRHTLIGMNPITSKYQAEITLHLGGEEGCHKRLAPHSQLHGSHLLSTNGITSTNAADHFVRLDQLVGVFTVGLTRVTPR